MNEPPEDPRPLFADEEFAPRRPLTGPGVPPPPQPAPDATPLPQEYYTEPAPSRKPLGVAVLILAVLALVLAGTTVWAFMSAGSQVSDLNAQLDSANAQVTSLTSQVTDLQGQLDTATQSGSDQSAEIDKLNAKVKKLRKQVKASIPISDLPIVVYRGGANKKLKAEFQSQLIQPMVADAQSSGNTLVSVDVVIPTNDGDPYSYVAIYANGSYDSASYGTKGSPLPKWTPT